VERRKKKLTARWTAAKESIMGSAADVQTSVKAAGDAGHQLPEATAEKIQGAPMVAGVVAFSLGFLAAAIFPGTETEADLAHKAQEIAQPAVEELKQSGQEAVSALKEPVLESAQHVKDAAASSAREVQGAAQEAVDQTKDAASRAGGKVSDQTKQSAENALDR
jgi:hypothetical protein